MRREETVYELLELIGEKFLMDMLENEDIRDDIFDILEESILTDLRAVVKKIQGFKNMASRSSRI